MYVRNDAASLNVFTRAKNVKVYERYELFHFLSLTFVLALAQTAKKIHLWPMAASVAKRITYKIYNDQTSQTNGYRIFIRVYAFHQCYWSLTNNI